MSAPRPRHVRRVVAAAGAAAALTTGLAGAAPTRLAAQNAAPATLAQPTAPPPAALPAGQPPASPLDGYVAEALRNNLGLAQSRLSAERSASVVRQARGRFLPTLGVDARYTNLAGNALNLGTLVNPAYSALNQLSGTSQFPTNVNGSLPVAQETRLRLSVPVYQPTVNANLRVAEGQRGRQDATLDATAQQLAADVRRAYLDVARAARLVDVYTNALPLVGENLRVSQRLVAGGRATPDVVFRGRAEQSEVEQQFAVARDQQASAVRGFNFLLNRPLNGPVTLVPDSLLDPGALPDLGAALAHAAMRRAEVRQVAADVRVNVAERRFARASYLPSVTAGVDFGVQGQEYRFRRGQDLTAATVALQWNLFNGGQDRARVEQAAFDGLRLQSRRAEVDRQVAREVETAAATAAVARRAIATAADRLASAGQSFRLVERRYGAGLATLVEFIDARTAFTRAQLNQVITTYDYYTRYVELTRAAALDPVAFSR